MILPDFQICISVPLNTSPCYQGPQFFLYVLFCFVFKRFCLTFKVVHVYESISYFILNLFACCICCLHVYSASGFVSLYDCTVFMFVFVFRLHNKDKYQFTKIFVLVKGIREFNIFFSQASVSTNLTFEVNVSQYR